MACNTEIKGVRELEILPMPHTVFSTSLTPLIRTTLSLQDTMIILP